MGDLPGIAGQVRVEDLDSARLSPGHGVLQPGQEPAPFSVSGQGRHSRAAVQREDAAAGHLRLSRVPGDQSEGRSDPQGPLLGVDLEEQDAGVRCFHRHHPRLVRRQPADQSEEQVPVRRHQPTRQQAATPCRSGRQVPQLRLPHDSQCHPSVGDSHQVHESGTLDEPHRATVDQEDVLEPGQNINLAGQQQEGQEWSQQPPRHLPRRLPRQKDPQERHPGIPPGEEALLHE